MSDQTPDIKTVRQSIDALSAKLAELRGHL